MTILDAMLFWFLVCGIPAATVMVLSWLDYRRDHKAGA